MLRLPLVYRLVIASAFVASFVTPAGAFAAEEDAAPPAEAAARLDAADGLQATLFAAEPMLLSPTNIDVDAKGRVWVCEVVNYRRRNGERPEGDRILILTDQDGDGVADERKVFYQGRDVDSALGIGVFGNRVIVSCSPNIWVFTDEDGDDRPDDKRLLFSNTGDAQHDHSAHAFTFGADGKLYWNFGNTGRAVHDHLGNIVVDKTGHEVAANGRPYQDGMAFRCDLDGSNFEVLGFNFRNGFEVAVDSLGNVWQSDNDDDGNRATRMLYMMERGNYGFKDEMTGATWRVARTGMHEDVPVRHWHQRDPGVVPNMLLVGPGSPSGLCVYEGQLLPSRFWNQLVHCEPYYNSTRIYPVSKQGAGYTADIVEMVRSARDKWFRPVDVCTAPDGSLMVADWSDPGVGGHLMGDVARGRIFRIAPPNAPYQISPVDCSTVDGAISALCNPALSVRYLGWQKLHAMQDEAEPALLELFHKSPRKRLRARAFWLLGKIDGRGAHYVELAMASEDEDFRIMALRLARQLNLDLLPIIEVLAADPSPQVRRECAIALEGNRDSQASALWAQLATAYDGRDRWYLEALGIGARGTWDDRWAAYLAAVDGNWHTPPGRDLAWRSRSAATPKLLAQLIVDETTSPADRLRYFRAFDFLPRETKLDLLLELAFGDGDLETEQRSLIASEAVNRLEATDLDHRPEYRKKLSQILDAVGDSPQFVDGVRRFHVVERAGELLSLAQRHSAEQLGVDAVNALYDLGALPLIQKQLAGDDLDKALATVEVLGTTGDVRCSDLLAAIALDESASLAVRRQAVNSLANVDVMVLVDWIRAGKLPPELKEATAAAFHTHPKKTVRDGGQQLFPLPQSRTAPLPHMDDLLEVTGNAVRGKVLFDTTGKCLTCHVVNETGREVGPGLADIGDKLSRQSILESILFPSAAISHGYESYLLQLEGGRVTTGLLVSDAGGVVTLKEADGISRSYDKADVEEMLPQTTSLMPSDLAQTLTAQELMDIVEYATTLKKPQPNEP